MGGEELVVLNAVPKHWFSWDFAIRDATRQPVAEVRLSSWRERGAVSVKGVEHKVSRHGVLRGAFVLEHDGKRYTLKARSMWRRERVLYDGDREIGAIIPEGLFGRRARVELPDDLPLVLRLFVVWLTMLLWKRDSGAAAV